MSDPISVAVVQLQLVPGQYPKSTTSTPDSSSDTYADTSAPFTIENVERIVVEVKPGRAGVVVNDVDKALPEAVETNFVASYQVFDFIGATPQVNQASGNIEIKLNGTTLTATVGSTEATVDGKTVNIYIAPKMGTAGIMVPVRTIADALGITTWEADGTLFLRYDRH